MKLPSLASLRRSSTRTQRLWNRALLFAGGLLVLWALVQLAPAPDFGAAPPAAERTATETPARAEAPALLTPGRMLALLLLAGGAAGAVVLHRRTRENGGAAATPLRPVGTFSMAPNQDLRLVACGDEVLLLGVTPSQISLLKTYPRADFDALDLDAEPAPAAPPAFNDLLRRAGLGVNR